MSKSSSKNGVRLRADAPAFVPYKPICDSSIASQLVEAETKIDSSRVLDPIGDESAMYAMTTMRLYGDFARAWLWSPNHTDNVAGEQPLGFQFNMSPQSPVYPDPFSRRAMFNGMMAIPVDMPNISLRHFADPANRVSERMLEEIDNEADLGGPGDDTNFAGIFSTTTRTAQSESTVFWLATQSHSLEIADQTYKLLVDSEPESVEVANERSRELIKVQNQIRREQYERDNSVDGSSSTSSSLSLSKSQSNVPFTTVHKLFFGEKEMQRLRAQQREHRARVLAKLMKSASIVSAKLGSSLSVEESAKKILASRDLVEITINDVDRVDKTDPYSDIVYTSNMASIYDVTPNGVLMRDGPRLGLDILRGPWNIDEVANAQRNAEKPFISVPVCTGMRQTNALRFETAEKQICDSVSCRSLISGDVWLWKPLSASADCHFLLEAENTRTRTADQKWLKFETACGFPQKNPIQHLSNVCIRLASPEHCRNHIERFR